MKYIGLDLGSVTCGISKSDTGFIAQPVKTIRFTSEDYDECFDKLLEFFDKEYKPDLIVMGYPLLENGDAGVKAQLCAEFARVLQEETGIKVELQDERYTTKDSQDFLISIDMSRKKRKKIIDQQAAVRILQYYLDAHKNK
ncbi:MAG: Holliday junction resolvase RuvX [Erysipelotrichaceae bacterium]|nr:Holliday junction resolvase RuvX [Erysipelotrichaceae bacterium]